MRRLLLLCLLVMLPIQGVWSAVANMGLPGQGCATAKQLSLHGAHSRADNTHASAAVFDDASDAAEAAACCGADCSSCHHHPLVALISVPVVLGSCTGNVTARPCARGAPDHIPDRVLRPPSLHAA